MIQTECGIFTVISQKTIDSTLSIKNLSKLQHRGRESFGLSWFDTSFNNFAVSKHMGIITQQHTTPFTDSSNNIIFSKIWLGHLRYSTSAAVQTIHHSQPILSIIHNYSLAHNGNIPSHVWPIISNKHSFIIPTNDVTDSFILSLFINHLLNNNIQWPDVIKTIIQDIPGVYSLVIITPNNTFICRDRFGIRPMSYLHHNNSFYIASETTAINSYNTNINDILPGQVISIDNNTLSTQIIYHYGQTNYKFCIFEFIYFMRDDSTVNSLSVKNFKHNIGTILAKQFISNNIIDISNTLICGVPQSGIGYATAFANQINANYLQFLQRNTHYPWRTFILKTNKQRLQACKQKYIIANDITNKSVVLVDDSIVRGNTLKHLISLIKSYSPKHIHFVVASPPIKYTCHYGVDFADVEDLVANKMTVSQMVSHYGFDSLTYLNIDSIQNIPSAKNNFCNACFTGNYLF